MFKFKCPHCGKDNNTTRILVFYLVQAVIAILLVGALGLGIFFLAK